MVTPLQISWKVRGLARLAVSSSVTGARGALPARAPRADAGRAHAQQLLVGAVAAVAAGAHMVHGLGGGTGALEGGNCMLGKRLNQ